MEVLLWSSSVAPQKIETTITAWSSKSTSGHVPSVRGHVCVHMCSLSIIHDGCDRTSANVARLDGRGMLHILIMEGIQEHAVTRVNLEDM